MDRRALTPEVVNALVPPVSGERWVGDADLRGFGVRLWAGKKGGGACYAIRLRDEQNRIVRESFSIWSSWYSRPRLRRLLGQEEEEFDLRLGHFLDDARAWAHSRIRDLKGGQRRRERRNELYRRASIAAQKLTLGDMAERVLTKLEKSGKSPDYVVQLRKLFWRLSEPVRSSLMTKVNIRKLGKEIADPDLPIMQSRTLQSFIGQLYSRLGKWHYPRRSISEKLNEHISSLRAKQDVPHPQILEIAPEEYERFLALLTNEQDHWREALALELYFETGAKMRRVLRARWDQILGDTWYPYSAAEREYWFVGSERLSESAIAIVRSARQKLESEGKTSDYLFPSKFASEDRPITTVRRYWIKAARELGWQGLPLSHVVQRHRPRNTPSYLYMYSYMWVPLRRSAADPLAVSKFGKLAVENSCQPAT